MEIIEHFQNLGTSYDGTAAVSGGTALDCLNAAAPVASRRAVQIANHSGSVAIWVKFTARGAATPTISATSHHARIPPGEHLTVGAGANIQIWVISSDGATTAAFTAVELH